MGVAISFVLGCIFGGISGYYGGTTDASIIGRYLLPSFMSCLIVSRTLSIPGMILAETAVGELGALLKDAQNVRAVVQNPWLLVPGLFVVTVVLAFNFLGDGLRDAADPYKP